MNVEADRFEEDEFFKLFAKATSEQRRFILSEMARMYKTRCLCRGFFEYRIHNVTFTICLN